MKYIIDVPDTEGHYDSEYEMVTMRVHYGSTIVDISMDAKPYTEPERKDIEDEVWNFVDFMIYEMDVEEREECFGESAYAVCIHELTYQGAKAEYDEWKRQKDEIFNTGDEVWDDELKSRGVVLRIYNSGNIDILWDDGSAGECIYHKKIHKTGRHFPEVAELLEKMRGEEE